jgi:hypothetical protein
MFYEKIFSIVKKPQRRRFGICVNGVSLRRSGFVARSEFGKKRNYGQRASFFLRIVALLGGGGAYLGYKFFHRYDAGG